MLIVGIIDEGVTNEKNGYGGYNEPVSPVAYGPANWLSAAGGATAGTGTQANSGSQSHAGAPLST